MIKTKNAFTLIELIVVITILAILGTIAFMSLQGYSSGARDVKRSSDLNVLMKKIELMRMQWVGLSWFVLDDSSTLNGTTKIRIAWHEWISNLTGSYKAWNINFTLLDEKEESFIDPLFEVPYKIGYTSYGNQYELAATIEDDGEFNSLVVWSWNPRKSSQNTFQLKESSTTYPNQVYLSGITVKETGFRLWDLVRFNSDVSGKYKITSLSGDMVQVDQTITHTWSSIFLHGDETRSLIKRWDSDNAIDFWKGYKYTPYYK